MDRQADNSMVRALGAVRAPTPDTDYMAEIERNQSPYGRSVVSSYTF